MGQPVIKYIKKECLAPYFGMAFPATQIAWVREDLPESVKDYVEAHELCHLRDTAKNVLWREIKANVVGLSCHPIGFLRCLWMTVIDPERWKLYINRFRKGE